MTAPEIEKLLRERDLYRWAYREVTANPGNSVMVARRLAAEGLQSGPGSQWCPVCRRHHESVGEMTDAGRVTRPCPNLAPDDARNRLGAL